jgi:hypothetical protein
MKIIGAGIAGLLAANMLRHRNPTVIEKQPSLPNNHSAVLRFRSHVIGDVTGIEFKKVNVIKATLEWKNPVADALAYAEKNTGTMLSNRSIPQGVSTVERYIAPPNLIEQLADGIDINYGYKIEADGYIDRCEVATISTMPMPVLMDVLHYTNTPIFRSISGINLHAKVAQCDAYVSLYVPNPDYPFSRISLMGNDLVVEVPFVSDLNDEITYSEAIYVAASLLGIEKERLSNIEIIVQQYAKIQEIDEGIRKSFMHWASDKFNIYSLGRYACWRPGLLLDDLVQDIRLIDRWSSGGGYARKLRS